MRSSSRNETGKVCFVVLQFLVGLAACGDPANKPASGTPDPKDAAPAPTLRDTLNELLQSGARDHALRIAEERWRDDSLTWAVQHETAAWRQWALGFHEQLMDPLVGADIERALMMMGALIGSGRSYVPGEHLLLATLHKEHSKYLNRAGRKEEALRTAESGYAMLTAIGDTVNKEAIGLLNALGVRTFAGGDFDTGMSYMDRSIAIANSLNDPEQEATQMLRMAAYVMPDDSADAMGLFRVAEGIARAAGDTATWCTVLNGRSAYLHNNFGVYDSSAILGSARLVNSWSGFNPENYAVLVGNAIVYCRENDLYFELDRLLNGYERKVASLPFDPVLHAALRTSQAEAFKAMHDNRAAMAFATEAVALAKDHGLAVTQPQTAIRAFLILTAAQTWAEDHPSVIATAEEALAVPSFTGNQEQTIRKHIIANLGNARGLNGDPVQAITIMSQLLDEPSLRHIALNNIGKYYRELGSFERADSCSFLVLREADERDPQRTVAAIALSSDRSARGMQAEAEAFALDALVACGAVQEGRSERPVLSFAPSEVSRRFDATKQWCRCLDGSIPMRSDRPVAKRELLACDSVFRMHVDTLLRTTRDPMARTGLLDLMTESLDRSIRLLTEDDPRTVPWRNVLRLMELRRDHRWRSMQREDQASLRFGVPEDLLRTERRLIGMLEAMARKEASLAETSITRTSLILVRDSLNKVTKKIASISPGYHAALNGLEPIDPGIVMQFLAPDEQVIVLHLDSADRSLVAVHLSRDSISGQRGPMSHEDLTATVHELRDSQTNDRSNKLAAQVFGQQVGMNSASAVVILPDGPLWGVPFDILWSSWGTELLEPANFRYASSLSTLVQKPKPEPAARDVELIAYAPSYRAPASGAGVAPRADGLRDLGPLVANVEEVTEIVDLVGGDEFIAADAQESGFRVNAPGAEVFHLAMHGVIDSEAPFRSYLLFEQGDTSSENNGRLTISEIHDMELKADLAVLSACETGIGKALSGEGIMSLGRAFNYAGVPNVVSSLWKVDDLATKQIMVKFYEKLAEGMGKADALAEAKRWYRKEYPNEPPSKWAAFILIGDNEPVHLKKRRPLQPWLIGGGLAAVIAAMAARRRRLRRAA